MPTLNLYQDNCFGFIDDQLSCALWGGGHGPPLWNLLCFLHALGSCTVESVVPNSSLGPVGIVINLSVLIESQIHFPFGSYYILLSVSCLPMGLFYFLDFYFETTSSVEKNCECCTENFFFSPWTTWELPTWCPITVKILVCNSSEQHSFLHSCIYVTVSYIAKIQPSHSQHVTTNLTVGPVQVSLIVPRMDPVVISLPCHFRSLWTTSYSVFPQLSWPWQL